MKIQHSAWLKSNLETIKLEPSVNSQSIYLNIRLLNNAHKITT